MSVRAKFKCTSKEANPHGGGDLIRLDPVIDGSEENKRFFRATPGGQIQLATVNPQAAEQFEVGHEYYVDFAKFECDLPVDISGVVSTEEIDRESMLRWFAFAHLPGPALRQTSAIFLEAARKVVERIDNGRERAVALRKLLEAKDAAVRAMVAPGG